MKAKIKRTVRIKENTTLDEYTGFIFISNKILKNENPYKQIKLNVTKFFTNNFNNFFLENKVVTKNVNKHLINTYNIEKNNILCIDKIYEKPKKIIYLVYLDFNTKFNNSYPILNMYSLKKLEKYKDLYYCLFCESKKRKTKSEYKLFYNTDNYILIDIKHIYYYLCGNEHTCKDLKEYIDI